MPVNCFQGCNRSGTLEVFKQVHNNLLDEVCSDAPNQYMCADCKTVVNCVDGRAFPQNCHEDFCNYKSSFFSNVCYTEPHKDCSCPENNVFYKDPNNLSTFFICDDLGEMHIYRCPEGYTFDEHSVQCLNPSGLPSCTNPGTFGFTEDCNTYYTCIVTTKGWLQYVFQCPPGQFYNEQTEKCENPCNWKLSKFECKEEGRFGDPTDCRRFFVCTWDTVASSYRQVLRQCPDGFEWQQVLRDGSGRCTTMVTDQCTPVTTTHCIIPEGICES
ncbi:uncharacterized protein [Cherax quadricarinatus]|uniref:uncharacterized protein n=1 Tax=Cherax quadricarinatus TaxID=27406 RepID=UPI002379CEE1|nr:uncharacterized protein LOC128705739 [Cherax quadricarinatus]